MASIGSGKTGMRNQGGIADLIVKGAIALVTAAFFIGAYLQFRVTFWLALIAALSVYITLLMVHALLRRSERADVLASEVNRLEGELARVKGPGAGPGAAAPTARGPQRRAAAPAKPVAMPPPAVPTEPRFDLRVHPLPSANAPPAAERAAPAMPMPPQQSQLAPARLHSLPAVPAPAPPHEAGSGRPHAAGAPHSIGAMPDPAAAPVSDPIHDYWSFRPSKQSLPEGQPARQKAPAPVPAPVPVDGGRETDLEAVQGMIKRLANEVSLVGDPIEDGDQPNAETAMRASLEALYTTADTMRAAAARPVPVLARADHRDAQRPMPPPIAPGHARLSSVGEAISAGRMDVLLQSIVGLADHQVHHHEVIVSLRDERGTILPLAVNDRQLPRTGLLPLLDSARLRRAAQVAKSFAEDGHRQCVFMATSAESLATDRFLDDLASTYRQRQAVAGEVVLTFNQSDITAFSGMEWSALTDMRDLGFRFCVDGITDLDYEFTAVKAAGFGFVKIDAATLLRGLSGPRGLMPGVEVCRSLGEIGLAVIVGGISDEPTRAAIVECGVPLGQGPFFGAPVGLASIGHPAAGTAAA